VDLLEAHLDTFRGEIDQKPPAVSAKKIAGVPAYKLARKNVPVDLPAVRVTVHELTLNRFDLDRAHIAVRCSAGTYVRSIAHELGVALGCGAHLDSLVRTASGPFQIANAFTLERLQELKDNGLLDSAIANPASLLPEFPPVFVDDTTAAQIRHGRDFAVSAFRVNAGTERVKAIGPHGELVAIGRIALPHVYHPEVVMI
jgi:tRNA pseudouridine55 synthase